MDCLKNHYSGSNNQSLGRTLRLVLQNGRMTKPDMAAQLGVSLPTVSQNVRLLMDDGLLAHDGTAVSTGGRKAQTVVPMPNARLALGLDVTAHQVQGVLLDLQGTDLDAFSQSLPFSNSETYFHQLGEIAEVFLQSHGVRQPQLLGTGISIPGVLSPDGQMLTRSHVLRVERLSASSFSDHLPGLCTLCNDAKAAAVAELWDRRELGSAVYLSLSNSVGGAIVLNNQIYDGLHRHGGEFGHMTLIPDGRRCYCGQYGCMDAYCSAGILTESTGSLEHFFQLLGNGNASCARLWHRYAEHLALAIHNILTILDCPVILGGYVGARLTDQLLQELISRIEERATFEVPEGAVLQCSYRRSAAAVGAALLPIRSFLGSPAFPLPPEI